MQNGIMKRLAQQIVPTVTNKAVSSVTPIVSNIGSKLAANAASDVASKIAQKQLFYHGTPSGVFDTFRDNSYFTTNKDYAQRYTTPSASSLSTGKKIENPMVYEVYLNNKKPFDIRNDDVAKNIYIENYIKGGNALGIDPYRKSYSDITDIDWTEAENLRDFLQDSGYDYDSIIANEGGDILEDGSTSMRGDSVLMFNGKDVELTPQTLSKVKKPQENILYRGQIKGTDDFHFNDALSEENGIFSEALGPAYHFTPFKDKTASWGEPLEVSYNDNNILRAADVKKMIDDANNKLSDSKFMSNLYNIDPDAAEQIEKIADGRIYEIAKKAKKPFVEHIDPNDDELQTVYFYKDIDPQLTEQFRKNFSQSKVIEKFMPGKKLDGVVPIDDNVYDLPDANLTPDQRDFFKDSVMRDANGNLMPLYHSTPYQFDAFDNKKLGQNTLYTNTAFGHFVTPDKDFSKRFIDINNEGKTGQTYELYANIKKPITHPYLAGKKYSGEELNKIVEDYMIATDNQDFLDTLREYAEENGTSIYDEYMDMTLGGDDPFEMAGEEKKLLEKKGYDALEIVEGTKDMLVDDATDTTPVSSYAIFDGKNLKRISNKTPSGNPGFLSKKIKIADNQASLLDYTPPKDLPAAKKEVLPTDGLKGGKTTEFNEKMKNVFGKTQFEYITGKKKPTIDDMLAALPEDKYPNTRERLKEVDKLSKSPYFSSREITNRYKKIMNGVYPSYIAEKEFGTEFKNLPIEYKKRLIYLTQENTANMSIQGDNYMGNLDKQLSEDLGIGRSNTILTEGVGGLKSALGVYRPGPKDIGIERGIGDTRGKSVMAHERLHAFQHAEDGDYAPEVINAVDELKKDLEHSGAYNSMDYYRNINTLTANQKTYYNKHIEQQARMFQQYLRDKFNNSNGYTNHNPFKYETKQEYEFDPEKINPIFDKFLDRLRELSKLGYALPTILGVAVASKYLPKKEDKKS